MSERTINDHLSVLIAGSFVLLVAALEFPPLQALLGKEGIELGSLGLFLLAAYAAGHLVAMLGTIIENVVTLTFGSPTFFVTFDPPRLIGPQHVAQLEERLRGRFGLKIDRVAGMDRETWHSLAEQIYHDVATHNPGRIESSYGTYSLNRDLCAASLAAIAVTLALVTQPWPFVAAFAVAALVFAYRMRWFDVRFARELLFRFLALPTRPATTQPSSAPKR